jgi:hypothetical protein
MLDWKSIEKYSDLIEYYRGLLRIRENFAALSDCTAMTANNIESLENMPSGVCAYKIHNTESGKWKLMTVIFNGGSDAQNISLEDEWVQIANEETAGLRDLGTVSGNISVKPHSAAILIDKTSYENSSIEEYEGLLVVNYYDNKTKEKIRTQMVSDEVGKTYNVADIASSLNYDIKSSSGDTSGEFTKQIRRADVYVEEFEGKLSTITIKYVDDINGSELADSYVIRNRQGQPYFTPKLPDIENYTLVLDEKKDKRFIKVKYQPDVHNLSFYVVLFDNRHKPLGIKRVTINNAQALKSQLIPVENNVAGLFLQIVEADGEVFDQEYPCFITRRSILKASIFNGFIITIMSLLMSFGVSLVMNGAFFSSSLFGMYAFPATDTQTLFIVILAVFALTILVSFFLLRAINKKYLREDVEL